MNSSKETSGFLVLADISGYTEFVTTTEIDHGAQILENLINLVIRQTKPPLKVQEVEGDAVFSYALSESLRRGTLLVDMIDATYDAFKSTLEEIGRSINCTCRACASAKDLDMKFVVHHGIFARRATAGHEGISGPDVILAHRLLKNRIKEVTGRDAYAFFTSPAVKALAIDELTPAMVEHAETYEHLGEVRGWVYDVMKQRELTRANREIKVSPESAFLILTEDFRVPRAVAWEFYANPLHRRQWFSADNWIVEGSKAGRHDVGTTEHCIHGTETTRIRTLDWKPLRHATQAVELPMGGRLLNTATFEDSGDGTRVTVVFGPPEHDRWLQRNLLRVMMFVIGRSIRRNFTTCFNALFALIRSGEDVHQHNEEVSWSTAKHAP